MQSNDQMAYDRGSTIFSPDGRLYQVEYAREAVKRGSVTIGVKTSESVVLLAEKRINSPLLVSESIEKLYGVDEHISVAASGHVADARRLVDLARVETQRDRYMYDEAMDARTLAKQIGDQIQEFTQYGGTRPFGCALLVAGVTENDVQLIETEPSGAIIEYKAASIGKGRNEVEEILEERYEEEMSTEDGIRLAVKALKESDADTEIDKVEAMVVDTNGTRKLSDDDLRPYIEGVNDTQVSDDESEEE